MNERLNKYLPEFYHDIRDMQELLDSEGEEIELLAGNVESLLQQYYPESATWALSRYEKDLNIVVDAGKPNDQRRSVIISKMRGYGKVSASMMKNVAQAYDGGTVEVDVDPATYTITVTFVDTFGTPPNLGDLKAALNEIKPAHLRLAYVFRFFTYQELLQITYNQWETMAYNKFAGGA
ncbi:hypothetical protein D3C75_666460 [compost metagenome]